MALLQPLPSFGDPFLGTGGPGIGVPSGPGPTIGGPSYGVDIKLPTLDKGGLNLPPQQGETPLLSSAATAGNLISCFMSPTSCLLRLVFLILGLICVAGAIYLYKPTSELVAAPARAARDAVAGAAVAA